nr:MFS transporter [Deltaproteobacteria bacterium]
MVVSEAGVAPVAHRRPRRIGGTVVLLGITSMITDISAEMITTVMPIYVVFQLGLTPLAFGLLEGLYQGATALLRLASGVVTDRWQRPKEIATAGYALSALSKVGFVLLPGGLGAITALTVVDRFGKGIRTAPRDAMIAAAAPTERLATAFGIHRAFDTAGSMIGPFVSLAVLALAPRAFGAVFALSACIALIGVALVALLVRNPPVVAPRAARPRLRTGLAAMIGDRKLRALLVATTVLGLATASDAFLYLVLQRRIGFNPGLFPLLYVATAGVFLLLAVPAGRLADRIGRRRAFFTGYGLLLAAYVTLLVPFGGWAAVASCVVLLGAYYAATDGILMALVASIVPAETRASGLALVTTAASVAKVVSSIAFGALWSAWGTWVALAVFAVGLAVALAIAALLVV